MTLEEDAKQFTKAKEDVEPVALQCGTCHAWSGYSIRYNEHLPPHWIIDDKGKYKCDQCTKHNKG